MMEKPSILRPDVPDGVHVGRYVLLPEELNDELLADSLERVFSVDDELEAVVVEWPTGSAYVLREEFLNTLEPEMRSVGGFGDADQLFLPGKEKLKSVTFHCPMDGQQFDVFFLNPGEIRSCPKHPDMRLVAAADG